MNVSEIEDKVAANEMTAAQVFTQMRQLIPKSESSRHELRAAFVAGCENLYRSQGFVPRHISQEVRLLFEASAEKQFPKQNEGKAGA